MDTWVSTYDNHHATSDAVWVEMNDGSGNAFLSEKDYNGGPLDQ